jgi:hypothetical protein
MPAYGYGFGYGQIIGNSSSNREGYEIRNYNGLSHHLSRR